MCHRDILDWDASIIVEIPKVTTSEQEPKVGDDAVRQTKPVDDVVKQLDCFLCYSLDQGFVFDLLGEFVNADIDQVKASQRGLEWSNHI